jgi:hypothetical protein
VPCKVAPCCCCARPQHDGTTALVSVQVGATLVTANAGDCRAVLCRDGQALRLSRDHKVGRGGAGGGKEGRGRTGCRQGCDIPAAPQCPSAHHGDHTFTRPLRSAVCPACAAARATCGAVAHRGGRRARGQRARHVARGAAAGGRRDGQGLLRVTVSRARRRLVRARLCGPSAAAAAAALVGRPLARHGHAGRGDGGAERGPLRSPASLAARVRMPAQGAEAPLAGPLSVRA